MVAIVTTYRNQRKILEHYWCPLIHKHGDVEFLIVDHDSRIEPLKRLLPQKKNVMYLSLNWEIAHAKNINITDIELRAMGVNASSHNTVLITDIKCIPTYESMVHLDKLEDNQMLCPQWHTAQNEVFGPNTYSVNKNKFKNATDKKRYIEMYNPEMIDHTTVYYAE
jgi:hypothetical protein